MAEFVQTMKDWRRMCKVQEDTTCGACSSCPMGDDGKSCMAVYEDEFETVDFAHIEQTVTEWAAEHPEPVYPSIAKYLERFGIIIRRDGSLQADFFKANEPMSAYMANLLDISPEEGENEKAD
jgi:hypothetical protein